MNHNNLSALAASFGVPAHDLASRLGISQADLDRLNVGEAMIEDRDLDNAARRIGPRCTGEAVKAAVDFAAGANKRLLFALEGCRRELDGATAMERETIIRQHFPDPADRARITFGQFGEMLWKQIPVAIPALEQGEARGH